MSVMYMYVGMTNDLKLVQYHISHFTSLSCNTDIARIFDTFRDLEVQMTLQIKYHTKCSEGLMMIQ